MVLAAWGSPAHPGFPPLGETGKGDSGIRTVQRVLCESGQTTLVQTHLDVTVPDPLQIDHGRGDIAVSHPLLKRSDVDAVLQVPCGVGVAELVEEPASAKGAIGTAIDFDGAALKLVRDSAVSAIQLATPDHGFELFQHGAVGPAGCARE